MYKVFCEDRCLILLNEIPAEGVLPGAHAVEPTSALLNEWLQGSVKQDIIVKSQSLPNLFFKAWMPSLLQVEAAGGVVETPHKGILFIYRNQYWDLPKGHVDPGERHLETAFREVEEETGLQHLRLIKTLPETWHCYQMKGKWHLKHTCWYHMHYDGTEIPQPQLSEGITRTEWIGHDRLAAVLSQSYRSVQEVLGLFMVSVVNT